MMKKVISLTKVFLKNSFQFNYNRTEIKNAPKSKTIRTAILFLILFVYLMGAFGVLSYSIISSLQDVNQESVFLGLLLLLVASLAIFQTIFTSINVFYFSKDITYVLPLPLKPLEILMAKFNVILFSEYVVELMLGLPSLIIYGVLTTAGPLFYIYGVLVLALFPIVPAVLSCILVTFFMSFSKITRNKDRFQYFVAIITIVAAIAISLLTTNTEEVSDEQMVELFMQGNNFVKTLEPYFITLQPSINMMTEPNTISALLSFLKLLGITFVAYGIFLLLGKKLYFKGVIDASVSGSKSREKINNKKAYTSKKIGRAYVLKEFKLLFRNPIYFMQCVLPSLIFPAFFALLILVGMGGNVSEIADSIEEAQLNSIMFSCIAVSIIQFLREYEFYIYHSNIKRWRKCNIYKIYPNTII